jgi:hypothetical protein
MNDSSNTAAGLDQADEDILTYTVSDEELEALARAEKAALVTYTTSVFGPCKCKF